MSDYQSGSDEVEAEAVAEVDAHPFYSSSEQAPTEEVEAEEIVAESEEESVEEEVEDLSEDTEEAEEEVDVFDQPDDFAKYDFDEESGLYEFKSEGKKVKVNVPQLIKSWREDRKLTSELQTIANERKGLWSEAQQKELKAYQEQASAYQAKVQELQALVGDSEKSEEYWEELRDTDISEYTRQKELEEKRLNAVNEALATDKAATEANRQALIQRESQKLLDSVAEWKDEKVRAEEFNGMQEVALSLGVSLEEQNNIPDSRFWLAMRELMQFRKLKERASTKKPESKKPKVTKAQRAAPKSETKSTAQIFYGE